MEVGGVEPEDNAAVEEASVVAAEKLVSVDSDMVGGRRGVGNAMF
jgi:hypothetical protein